MTELAVAAAASPAGSRQQAEDDHVLDVTVDRLVLDVVRGTRGGSLDARIDDVLVSGSITFATQEAPTLTLEILDADLRLLQSGMFAYALEVELDDVPFRLVKVSLLDDDHLSLLFEHRLVAWMREHDSPLHESRGKRTRAEFVQRMVREVKKGRIRFVSPSLHKKQPIRKMREATKKRKGEVADGSGFVEGVDLDIGGASATRAQLAQADRALTVAKSLNASPKAVKAMVVAGIGESGFKPIPNAAGSGYEGVFQASPKNIPREDTEQQAHYFLTGGKGFQGGGAMALAKLSPLNVGGIATRVEASGQPAIFYGKWASEADAIIKAWNGGDGAAASSADSTYGKRYDFTRGQPGQREDTWTAGRRLADEVRWRFFVAGRASVYFINDFDLAKRQPAYMIGPDTPGVLGVTFDAEVGKRTIVVKGKRQPKPSEATVRARLDRFHAFPGTVIELDGYGPGDGRWLVDSISRSIFDAEGTILLRAPQKQLSEPAHEPGTRAKKDGEMAPGKRGRVKVRDGANRPGRGLQKPLLQFLALVAGKTREEILVNYGTNHDRLTTGGNVSDHWVGDAADLNVGGDARSNAGASSKGDNIAVACLMVCGVDRETAHGWATSGALNFGVASTHQWRGHRVQIGWKTLEGGNHFNHVHVGVKSTGGDSNVTIPNPTSLPKLTPVPGTWVTPTPQAKPAPPKTRKSIAHARQRLRAGRKGVVPTSET